jgi:hypothetical protein
MATTTNIEPPEAVPATRVCPSLEEIRQALPQRRTRSHRVLWEPTSQTIRQPGAMQHRCCHDCVSHASRPLPR